ncbi:MAG: methionine ABC transporter ATP-binding protein [Lachnospiraceae bacterium]|nr:methionine ABC transporter ATP-binding protein [Lachnospiraceae bacterium]
MITLENVSKSFQNTTVLSDVSLRVGDGEIYGIIGQSGAGKSTLLRCINGLVPYEGGAIAVDGEKVFVRDKAALRKIQRRMGMIFQNFHLLNRLDVYDNVALPMRFWGMHPKSPEAKEKITSLLRMVGLEDKMHQRPRELSGGQKQRVAIARALVLDPQYLLCDEATSALDPKITKGILALLQDINKKMGITIVVVTHQMEVVKQICERVAFLKDGRVLAEGSPEALFVRPPHAEIKSFLHEGSDTLPKSGVNIQLFFNDDSADEPLITRAATELGINISIMWAKVEDFRDRRYGTIIVNVEERDRDRVIDYLKAQNVLWEVL